MAREIIFEPEARIEFEDACIWHEVQQPGLGDRFEVEVHTALQNILHAPDRFRFVGKSIRVARLDVFSKYGIYFHVEPDFIGVVSIFHGSRNPDELQRRLK